MAQMIFQRIEKKYLLTKEQHNALAMCFIDRMVPDQYGKYTIANLYYDTDTYELARHSIEKPIYKEKLRLRSYGKAGKHDNVFLELKKKYDDIVYKRRATLPYQDAINSLTKDFALMPSDSQILREIGFFWSAMPYRLRPIYVTSAMRCSERTMTDLG